MNRLFILVVVIIISCNTVDDSQRERQISNVDSVAILKPTYQSVTFNKNINNIIDSFLHDDTCKECIHEMYIDKIRPDQITIVLKSRVYATQYSNNINPLFFTQINGISFYIYSGIEDIFVGDRKKIIYPNVDTTGSNYRVWSLLVMPDSIKIEKDIGMPFFPSESPHIEIKK